ncbi:MAG: YgfZ/GcvT domain-containing protein, partial [Bacteroidota bacterium]
MNIQDSLVSLSIPDIWWSLSGIPGIIKVKGHEVVDLVHRLSTNNCLQISDKLGKQTILTNEKGRIVDIITLLQHKDHYLLLTSRDNEEVVIKWLKKYIIIEDITFSIITDEVDMITVHGSRSMDCISQLLHNQELHVPIHSLLSSTENPNRIAIRCMPIHEMQFLIIDSKGNGLIDIFTSSDIILFDKERFEIERILSGMGIYGNELYDAYNPLEAGLLHLIDFKKGCYIGQEVIARLDSYNKVQKRIMGFISELSIPLQSTLLHDNTEIGIVTSSHQLPNGSIGLAYIR